MGMTGLSFELHPLNLVRIHLSLSWQKIYVSLLSISWDVLGQGFLHGVANENGLATGNEIAYIYPDGETAFKGQFENKHMKKA